MEAKEAAAKLERMFAEKKNQALDAAYERADSKKRAHFDDEERMIYL